MIRLKQPVICNDAGEPIVLTKEEKHFVNLLQRQIDERWCNSLGYAIPIDTLTTILKKVSEQRFFDIAFADYVPVKVGEGAWSRQLTTYQAFILGDDFATGILDTGADSTRLASADAGVQAINTAVANWAKEINWNVFDLEQAAMSGNWDLITQKEQARKKNWDLGVQKVAFLGLSGDGTNFPGLLTQSGVTVDTTTLTQPISSLSTVDFKNFCAAILNVYRANCSRTAWPSRFIIPESDFLGMAAPTSAEFPLKSVLQVLEETFAVMTKRPDFKILPCAYGDNAYNGQSYNEYCLLNYDETSVRMNLPVDYTNTLANSVNNFGFQNVGYGQFTGVTAIRPAEMYYLRVTPS